MTCTGGTDRHLRIVVAGVFIYLVGLLCFFPDVIIQLDEAKYLEMAYAFSKGSSCVNEIDPLSGEILCKRRSSRFLPGTSALLAPAIALFGWRGAYLVPALALAAATLCTALWLREAGRHPLFALMVLGYLPSLVLGRVAQSDVPSTALAALGLWLFWASGPDRRIRWAASGFVAGLSLSVRETNALLFAPLYLGALIRREGGTWALIAGGIAGTLLWPLGTWIVFGDPFYIYRRSWIPLTLANVPGNLPVYTLALLVFIPAGLIAGLLYRGNRWPEVVVTVSVFCVLYLSWGYHGENSGLLRSLILGPRFFSPLTPLLAFAAAEAVPRLWAGIRVRFGTGGAEAMERIVSLGVRLWVAGVLIMAFAVHPVLDRLTDPLERFREAIYSHTTAGSVVVIPGLDRELVQPMFGERQRFSFDHLTPEILDELLARHGSITVVLHDRRHSPYLRGVARENQEKLNSLARRAKFELLFDRGGDTSEHLRIWRVSAPSRDNDR